MPSRSTTTLCALLVFIALSGCAKKHRPLEEIEAQKRDLPTLYLTEKTSKRVMAPSSTGLHVDTATGELCYQPFECINPDCPGRTAEENHLFVHRDVLVSVGPAGEIVYGSPPEGVDYKTYVESRGGHMTPTCPKCLEKRNLASETDAQRQQYQAWVRPYELPATVQSRAELEEEYQAAFAAREKLRQGE